MKKVQIIINIVLAVAVIALFVLNLTGKNTTVSSAPVSKNDTINAIPNNGQIVYVNIDSVVTNYDYALDLNAELERKFKTAEAEISAKQKSFLDAVKDFEYKAQKQLDTRSNLQKRQQELAQEEQNLMALSNQLDYQLNEENMVMQNKLMNAIIVFLEEYNSDKGYQYILAKGAGSNILYSSKQQNITAEVISGLNAKYAKKNDK